MNEQMKGVLQNLCNRVVSESDPKQLQAVIRELDEFLACVQQEQRMRVTSTSPNPSLAP